MGDFILVNKYDYGLRLPVVHTKLINMNTPQRGDIIVFRWPPNTSYDFIKRVIGLPGDKIKYVKKELYINGEKIPQADLKNQPTINELGEQWDALRKSENLLGVNHDIFIDPKKPAYDYSEFVVPKGMYFVMGDNRDNSADSRYWGFVPEQNIVGKAVVIWMSWNGKTHRIRWDRLGKVIN
jgi:signal peptidase I